MPRKNIVFFGGLPAPCQAHTSIDWHSIGHRRRHRPLRCTIDWAVGIGRVFWGFPGNEAGVNQNPGCLGGGKLEGSSQLVSG